MRSLLVVMLLAGSAMAKPSPPNTKTDPDEPTKNEPTKNEPTKNEPTKNEPTKNESTKAASKKTESEKAASEKAASKKTEPAKAESEKTEPKKSAKSEPDTDEPKNGVLAMTDDPLLARADKIDGNEAKGVVTFTFDDGPNPETTPAVIDALEKYNIPATFFIVTQRLNGKHGEKPREILKRLLDAGFLVGSHSVTHPNLKLANKDKLAKEIDGSIRTLSPAAERPIGLFRFPFGAANKLARARLHKLGLTEAFWSIDTLDWQARDAAKLRKKVHSMILEGNGGVVLMHDVKPITAKIIADVFDDLEAENCARLASKKEPIVPVSIHYFLKDGKTARPVPDAVKKRTETYRANLPGRCAKRPAKPPEAAPLTPIEMPPTAPAKAPTKASIPAKS